MVISCSIEDLQLAGEPGLFDHAEEPIAGALNAP
jgi:hypothetical protein